MCWNWEIEQGNYITNELNLSKLKKKKKTLKTEKRYRNHLLVLSLLWKIQSASRVRLFVTPWMVAHQDPLFMEF